jgi:hypothetical protein
VVYGTIKNSTKGGGALASTQKRIQKDASSRMASLLPNMSTTSSLGLPLFDGEGGLVPELQGEGYLPMTQMFPFYKPEYSMNLGYS